MLSIAVKILNLDFFVHYLHVSSNNPPGVSGFSIYGSLDILMMYWWKEILITMSWGVMLSSLYGGCWEFESEYYFHRVYQFSWYPSCFDLFCTNKLECPDKFSQLEVLGSYFLPSSQQKLNLSRRFCFIETLSM
jgi:hypothetical protein